jgi:hypothetical protein
MLTLFKPWRDGMDLKSCEQTWDKTFISYSFTPKQSQLMRNFNIRYECLDVRDDYRAQLKKGVAFGSSWDDDVLWNLGESSMEDGPYVNPNNMGIV